MKKKIKFVSEQQNQPKCIPAKNPYDDLPPATTNYTKSLPDSCLEHFRDIENNRSHNTLQLQNNVPEINKNPTLTELDSLRFLNAAQHGDLESMRNLLCKGVDINCKDMFGWTAIQCALNAKKLKAVDLLLQFGADTSIVENQLISAGFINYDKAGGSDSTDSFKDKTDQRRLHLSIVDMLNKQTPMCSFYNQTSLNTMHRGAELLSKLGWNGKTGLGSREQGRLYPLRAIKKSNKYGIGYNSPSRERKSIEYSLTRANINDLLMKDKIKTMKLRKLLDV
ncbi:hypothetical protein GJ496_006804 [Pomphorhynchus laevis]|nr:hypothetical protein GJ496_006804 [Pomphorhynchus laevis]